MKAEAERLAEACDVCASDNSAWRLAVEAAALLRQWPDGKPVAYQYLFEGTYGPVWRNDDGLWNGQKPTASRPLYAAPPDQSARIAELEAALRFYAAGDHFNRSDDDAWDTVSGEPQNFWCDDAGTATVEDGAVARMAIAGLPLEDYRG